MSDNFLNKTGLQYYHNRIKSLFAKQADLTTLQTTVESIVAEGGEPNVIETVKVNNTALTPDSSKAVDITVPTKVSDLTNDGDGTTGSEFATKSYVDTNGGKIDVVKINGTAQTITNKEVDISVPTQVSDLTNDSGFQTATQVQSLIDSAVSSAYKYKGSVASVSALPATAETGDVYDVQDTGMNYAWNGSSWDSLGQLVDTSLLWAKSELTAITTAEIDTLFE